MWAKCGVSKLAAGRTKVKLGFKRLRLSLFTLRYPHYASVHVSWFDRLAAVG